MASVIVSELVSRRNVLTLAIPTLRAALPASNSRGYQHRYTVYAHSAPPKKSTSVMRNTHIPKRTVDCCCRRLSKWWATGAPGVPLAATDHPLLAVGRPVRVSVAVGVQPRLRLRVEQHPAVRQRLQPVREGVLVRGEVHDWQLVEVVRRRRTRRL